MKFLPPPPAQSQLGQILTFFKWHFRGCMTLNHAFNNPRQAGSHKIESFIVFWKLLHQIEAKQKVVFFWPKVVVGHQTSLSPKTTTFFYHHFSSLSYFYLLSLKYLIVIFILSMQPSIHILNTSDLIQINKYPECKYPQLDPEQKYPSSSWEYLKVWVGVSSC